MRKFLPLVLFVLPWLALSIVLGGFVFWVILSADLGKTASVSLVCAYMAVATAVVWFVAPLAPPTPR